MRDVRVVAVSVPMEGSTNGQKEDTFNVQTRHEGGMSSAHTERVKIHKMQSTTWKVACELANVFSETRNEERKVIRSKLLSLTQRSLTYVMEKEQT